MPSTYKTIFPYLEVSFWKLSFLLSSFLLYLFSGLDLCCHLKLSCLSYLLVFDCYGLIFVNLPQIHALSAWSPSDGCILGLLEILGEGKTYPSEVNHWGWRSWVSCPSLPPVPLCASCPPWGQNFTTTCSGYHNVLPRSRELRNYELNPPNRRVEWHLSSCRLFIRSLVSVIKKKK